MKSKDEVISCLNRDLCICDTTIRDSENASGVVLSNTEKYKIAKLLDNAGIAQINAGMPMASPEEKKTVKRIARMGLQASIMSSNRAEKSDIDESLACEVDAVSIALPISDVQLEARKWTRKWVQDKLYETAEYALDHGLYVSYVMEDAARANTAFLMVCAMDAKELGVDRIVYSDSVGVGEPAATFDRIKMLKEVTEMDIGVQMRNDFGMATANTFSAMKAGAKFVDASIMGIGSRAGNAPLEEVALVAEERMYIDTRIDLPALKNVAKALAKASGRKIWESKPVFGSGCFAQEGGISADGDADANSVLEPYDPALVGGVREIVLGKHTTADSVKYTLKEMKISVDDDEAVELAALVKQSASDLHRSLSNEDLFELYNDMKSGSIFDEDEDEDDEDFVKIPTRKEEEDEDEEE